MTILKFENVSKSFGSHNVFKNVSFELSEGRILGLIGQSGSGKTTLIRMILGLYKADEGKVTFSRRAKNVGLASQHYAFYPRLSVMENLNFYGKMYGMKKADIHVRAELLLRRFELYHAKDVRCSNLSGGMQRRLDMVIALIHDPKILILDEPTTGLDVVLRNKMWSFIRKIKNDGVTVIVSSHDLDDIQRNCDDIMFIYNHSVLTPRQLKTYLKKYTLEELFKQWYVEKS